MSERLKDLQRQRALAQEQLAWLDREIARETGAQVPPPPAPTALAAGLAPKQPATPSSADADALIARYQDPGRSVHSETKRGCFLYFFVALGAVALGVIAFWFLRYR